MNADQIREARLNIETAEALCRQRDAALARVKELEADDRRLPIGAPTWAEICAALLCDGGHYTTDICDNYTSEEGFTRCTACRMRDRLAALAKAPR